MTFPRQELIRNPDYHPAVSESIPNGLKKSEYSAFADV